jgi:hypothetical protein
MHVTNVEGEATISIEFIDVPEEHQPSSGMANSHVLFTQTTPTS